MASINTLAEFHILTNNHSTLILHPNDLPRNSCLMGSLLHLKSFSCSHHIDLWSFSINSKCLLSTVHKVLRALCTLPVLLVFLPPPALNFVYQLCQACCGFLKISGFFLLSFFSRLSSILSILLLTCF